jgi:hypothetical protein
MEGEQLELQEKIKQLEHLIPKDLPSLGKNMFRFGQIDYHILSPFSLFPLALNHFGCVLEQ